MARRPATAPADPGQPTAGPTPGSGVRLRRPQLDHPPRDQVPAQPVSASGMYAAPVAAPHPSSQDCLAMRGTCVSFNARRAERALADLYNERMSYLNISVAQLPVLAILSAEGPLTLGRLAEIVELDPSTLSRNLALLERRGVIAYRAGEDRRTRYVELTNFGCTQFREAYARWTEVQAELRAAFPANELDYLLDGIRRLGAWAKHANPASTQGPPSARRGPSSRRSKA